MVVDSATFPERTSSKTFSEINSIENHFTLVLRYFYQESLTPWEDV